MHFLEEDNSYFSFAGHDIVLDVGVLCNSEDITLTLTVTTDFFNGMIYPKGLSKNSTCMTEYIQQEASRDYDYHARMRTVQPVVSCQGGCHVRQEEVTATLTQSSTDCTISTDFHSNHNPSQQSQCNNVRDTVTNNTPGRIIINDITIQGLIKYTLPLRSCNTMSTDVLDGVEYFNTVVVQPHRKLVTNQGRGYHVRCRYQTEEKLLQNDFNVR